MPSQWTVDKPVELVEAEGRLASLREEVADFDGLDDSAMEAGDISRIVELRKRLRCCRR